MSLDTHYSTLSHTIADYCIDFVPCILPVFIERRLLLLLPLPASMRESAIRVRAI
jgi:hypothetical protein